MSAKGQITTSDYLDYQEFKRLLIELREDGRYFWELYATMSFCTGCRASDVRVLKWKDFLGKSSITVTEKKTGKTRKIQINSSVQEKIKELYKLMGEPDKNSYAFASTKSENPTSLEYINRELKKMKYQYVLRIKNFSTHTFRKTFGRYVYESMGKTAHALILLSKILNHSSIEMTRTYIGLTQDDIDYVFENIKF